MPVQQTGCRLAIGPTSFSEFYFIWLVYKTCYILPRCKPSLISLELSIVLLLRHRLYQLLNWYHWWTSCQGGMWLLVVCVRALCRVKDLQWIPWWPGWKHSVCLSSSNSNLENTCAQQSGGLSNIVRGLQTVFQDMPINTAPWHDNLAWETLQLPSLIPPNSCTRILHPYGHMSGFFLL